MRISTGGRGRVSHRIGVVGAVVLLLAGSGIASAQQRGRGAQRPAAAPAPAAPAPGAPAALPQIAAVGIRIVGSGLGANGSELRPFDESPGTVVVLAIQPPRGSGIVELDDHASKLDAFADDKGQNLLEEGRVGPFPKVAEDGSAAMVQVQVRARPSAGAASVSVQGSLAVTMAAGSKPVRIAARLEPNQALKVGATTMTIKDAKTEDESTKISFGLPRAVLNAIREVRFFDAKNTPIEARRTGSGYFNDKAELEFEIKTTAKTATIEFELWQNPRTVKVPFNLTAGLGVAAGGRTSGSGDTPASDASAKGDTGEKRDVRRADGPPPVISAADGAASVDAVIKQMQTAAAAGKAAQLLSVIYPNDRPSYGQGVAMVLAFLPMSAMDDQKASEQMQKDLDGFFARHQLKPPFAREPEELFKGIDLTGFVADSMAFLKSHAKKGDKGGDALPVPAGHPENVTITGDSAVGTMGGKEITFTRVSGRWFIRL